MKHYNIPVFVPHIGCPFDCVFCNQRHITGTSGRINKEEIIRTIEEHLSTIPTDSYIEIAFFGGSFTGIEPWLRREYLGIAYEYVKQGKVNGIRLSTRPDYIDKEILDELAGYRVTAIELGVQSMDEQVLAASQRGHTAADVENAVELIRNYDFELGLQMMTGLPEDTDEGAVKTAEKIIALSPDCVRIYPTLVIADTRLADMFFEGTYTPQELDSAVSLSARLLKKFESAGIKVIRIALMTTDEISPGGKLIAGPFHAAFREKVESRLFLERFEAALKETGLKSAEILVNLRDLSKAIGDKRENILKLRKSLGVQVTIKAAESVEKGEFKITMDKE